MKGKSMKIKQSEMWTKKLGPTHISGDDGSTLCGIPMLGNNYSKFILNYVFCEKCLALMSERCGKGTLP
jgi:hypothetical protein